MSAMGELPRLDAVIFADTKGELPETYEYARLVEKELAAVGIPFVTVSAGSLLETLYSPVVTKNNPTPPAYVTNPPELGKRKDGRINNYRCSFDFKRRLITREAKRLCGKPGAWKRSTVEQWLGFSADEEKRMRQDHECRCGHPMLRHSDEQGHPLASDVPASASTAGVSTGSRWLSWAGSERRPSPGSAATASRCRPACFFCPNSTNERWLQLQAEHPELWEEACRLDEHIRRGAAFNGRGNQPFKGEMFLHRQRVPLRLVDFRTKLQREADAGVQQLFDSEAETTCAAESCFT